MRRRFLLGSHGAGLLAAALAVVAAPATALGGKRMVLTEYFSQPG